MDIIAPSSNWMEKTRPTEGEMLDLNPQIFSVCIGY
jgi:hypothetical protein